MPTSRDPVIFVPMMTRTMTTTNIHVQTEIYRETLPDSELRFIIIAWSDDKEKETPESNTPLAIIQETDNLITTAPLITPNFTSTNSQRTYYTIHTTTSLLISWRRGTVSSRN